MRVMPGHILLTGLGWCLHKVSDLPERPADWLWLTAMWCRTMHQLLLAQHYSGPATSSFAYLFQELCCMCLPLASCVMKVAPVQG